MYSPEVVDKSVRTAEKALGLRVKRLGSARSIDRAKSVNQKIIDKDELSDEDVAFIRSEQVICRYDFSYWLKRYCTINIDASMGGGAGPLVMWEPQLMLLEVIAAAEQKCHAQAAAKEPVDGILVACNKARQIGFTMIWRALNVHRLTLHDYTRGMAASLNEELVLEIYERDKFIIDNLPMFLKPGQTYDVKRTHLTFANNSRLLYQESTQKGAMGISRQFEIGHLTEVSQWVYPGVIQFDLMPAIPQSIKTLFGMEAVPAGRGNFWHEFTEDVRKGKQPRWLYVFIPWYAEPTKYRRKPPLDWEPSEASITHAKKVYDTSHLYTKWPHYILPKENLYWWETTREEYRRAGNLNYFLSNYAATPEESFQHSGRSAFPVEYLEACRNRASQDRAVAYDVALPGEVPAA